MPARITAPGEQNDQAAPRSPFFSSRILGTALPRASCFSLVNKGAARQPTARRDTRMISGIYGCCGAVDRSYMPIMAGAMNHRGGGGTTYSTDRLELASLSRNERRAPSCDVPLVYSGRITNWPELRAIAGERDASVSEQRVLWALYRRSGVAGFERINGAFSIALFDAESNTLILAVDRWSTQPLHLLRLERGWLFATEYKALAACLPEAHAPDPLAVHEIVSSKYLPLHAHLDTRVTVIGPGEYARIEEADCALSSYRPLTIQIDPRADEQALAAELSTHLLAAADRLTRDHDVIAVGLSGGLDSTLTLGLLRKVAPDKRIIACTACAHEHDDALELARETARLFRAEHRVAVIHPTQLAQWLPELVWRMEDPIAREEMLVYHALAEQSAREASIMVYGHMADVLFGGMPRHLLIRAASRLPPMRRSLVEFYRYTQGGTQPRSWLGRSLVATYFRGRQASPPAVRGVQGRSHLKTLDFESEQPLNAALLKAIGQPKELSALERLHAWAGIEMASVFHDREVARCAFRIPDHMKIRGLTRKHILRVAAKGILPAELAARPKDLVRMGHNPLWRRELQRIATGLFEGGIARRRGLFELDAIETLCRWAKSPECTDQQIHHLWSAILVEIWCRTFADGHVGVTRLHEEPEWQPDLPSAMSPPSKDRSARARAQ